jgi:hypothetical protein
VSPLPRLLASLSVATVVAVAAPAAADAASSVTFAANGTTVQITDPGPSHPTVHMTVTSDGTSALADTKVLLGNDYSVPYDVVGIDGVHDARYAPDVDELSTDDCVVYDGPVLPGAPVTVAGSSFSVDLPKGEVIAFEDTGVDAVVVGDDPGCAAPGGYHGLGVDYIGGKQTIDGFSWDAPAAPIVGAAGSRRLVTLTFARERGTSYDVYPVVGGTRAADPLVANLRGDGAAIPVEIDVDADGNALQAGTTYSFQVQATRNFNVWDGNNDMFQPASPFSATTSVATDAAQAVRFGTGPAGVTTARDAQFTWTIDGNPAGEAPFCLLDPTGYGDGTEVPCTTTGATLAGLAVGTHSLYVYPADGESGSAYTWTIQAPAAATPTPAVTAPAPAPVIVPVKRPANDRDGDGIVNTWLIGGKPAPAPAAPKVAVSGGKVKLALPKAPKGATRVRVYRADGKGKFKAIKTVSAKTKSYTDAKAKAGHTYTYKIVAVNAKGKQGAASKAVTAKIAKATKKR